MPQCSLIFKDINLHQATITKENIVSHFTTYGVPKHFDLLSVDIDMEDFHVLGSIMEAGYQPRYYHTTTVYHVRMIILFV